MNCLSHQPIGSRLTVVVTKHLWRIYLKLYLNVRGLRSRRKMTVVKEVLKIQQPDIVIFRETKCEECDRVFIRSI